MSHQETGNHFEREKMDRKIADLFRYRHIPELIAISGIQDASGFRDNLISLQFSIYRLDHYLETSWDIEKESLDHYWNGIYASLTKFGIIGGKAVDWCDEIRQYQAHELNLRKRRWPTSQDFRTLYYYKSCDVRLIRRIVYDAGHRMEEKIPFDDWGYYDYITEINDDLDDALEDLNTFNGSRFLFSLLQYGKEKTGHAFMREIELLENEMKTHFRKEMKSPVHQELKSWTTARFRETKDLLDRQLKDLDSGALKEAAIIPYMDGNLG